MSRDDLIKKLKDFFNKNAGFYDIDMAFLYGSWAKGFPKETSDVDIAIFSYPEKDSEDEEFNMITDISLQLSEMIRKEINIISIHTDFRKPMLYYNVIVLGQPIYIKNTERYISLKNEVIYQMEDFSIFGINWQLIVANKNMRRLRNA
ncbi:MAG: nucleotidyltransferase domain-containing protein [Candidatus Brocadiaceae bacterium]|nr:nucleotidyltransferase domain-containing protein [Candidatus Brocadiaceae bacterium]